MHGAAPPAREPEAFRHGTAWFIILFWTAQFSLLTTQRFLAAKSMAMPADDWLSLAPRACVTLLGIALSFGIVRVGRRFHRRPIRTRMLIALACALVGCIVHAAGNFAIFHLFMPVTNWESFSPIDYFHSIIQWFWSYLALSGLLLALAYSLESTERERRIAQLRGIADAAQLRALRYQLNPHFMFNTLNSIAALISRREIAPAELMVENLADFLRASLSLDPQADITLDREIELQSLYLAIEAVRFSDRFEVRTDIAANARRALVPSLVLQPLIENVVKHSVSTSTVPVTLDISAKVHSERLHVSVRNSAGNGAPNGARSTGVGLSNVADRLKARFAEETDFNAGRAPDGGFAVRFSIPFVEANWR